MTTMERMPEVEVARRLRSRRAVDGLDYARVLRRLSTSMSQVELARKLGVTQPAISSSLKAAAKVPDPREGFSGASPYEIAQRYAAGGIERDQLIDELARWPYPQVALPDGLLDDLMIIPEGSFTEVGDALSDGLIDAVTYDAILDRQVALGLI